MQQKVNADEEVEEPDESSEDEKEKKVKVMKTEGDIDKYNDIMNKYLEEYKNSIVSRNED